MRALAISSTQPSARDVETGDYVWAMITPNAGFRSILLKKSLAGMTRC